MIHQQTLRVSLKDEATFANFFASSNLQLVNDLKKSAESVGERVIYFYGAGGVGCTHLLQAACHHANQHHQSSVYIPLTNLRELSPAMFEGLESLKLICIDDIHKIASHREWEEAFFHLYNRLMESGSHLIVSSNVPPKALAFKLPDVISRLSWGVVYQVQGLQDKDKLQVLMMRAERRGMVLVEDVGRFILNHCPRHMSTLFAALDALDKASLAAQRKLTIPFVKAVLEI